MQTGIKIAGRYYCAFAASPVDLHRRVFIRGRSFLLRTGALWDAYAYDNQQSWGRVDPHGDHSACLAQCEAGDAATDPFPECKRHSCMLRLLTSVPRCHRERGAHNVLGHLCYSSPLQAHYLDPPLLHVLFNVCVHHGLAQRAYIQCSYLYLFRVLFSVVGPSPWLLACLCLDIHVLAGPSQRAQGRTISCSLGHRRPSGALSWGTTSPRAAFPSGVFSPLFC